MSDHVKVDSSGHITPEDDSAKQRLAARAGRYFLTPSSQDLLLFVRSPPLGGKAVVPRVVLAGDIGGVPLVELVGFIHQSRRTGVLRVLTPSGERAVAFRDGEVRGAVSDNPRERLGEIAIRLGLVDRETVEKIATTQGHSHLGRALVDHGALKSHDLWKCLKEQVAEVFHGILLSQEGAFVVVEQAVENRGSTLALNTQGLLMDSIRRIDEMAEFRKRLPSDDAFLVPIQPPGRELDAAERMVFELCSGGRTLADVVDASHLSEFEALKVVYHLVEGRYVSVAQDAAPTPTAPAAETLDAVAATFNSVFREIRKTVAQIGVAAEFLAAANAAIPSQSPAARQLLDGNGFRPDGTTDADLLVKNAEAGKLDTTAVHSALSEVMFFLLFQAGELLEPKEDEDLAQRIKALLATHP